MSLLFIEGYDHYGTGDAYDLTAKKWDTVGGSGNHNIYETYPRYTGGRYLVLAHEARYMTKTVSQSSTLICGWAFRRETALGGYAPVSFYDSSTVQIGIHFDNSGYIVVRRGSISGGGTVLGTASIGNISTGIWCYVEAKVTFSNTVGTVVVKINGTEVINLTGQDTSQSGNEYADGIRINGNYSANPNYFDDIYMCNTSGSTNNDFIGDCRIETLYPDGAGNYSQWSPTGEASNYLCVDDDDPDDDTTYVTTSGTDFKDSYTMDDLTIAQGTIHGVQSVIYARKDDADYVGIEPLFRISSTDYTISGANLSDSYNYLINVRDKSPATETTWTISEVNSLEFGYNKNL